MLFKIKEKIKDSEFALFQLGFRPFFLGAGLFSIVAMFLWLLNYSYQIPIGLINIIPVTWHAHEMIYGYTLAVIFGFLLTAVGNWTGRSMPKDAILVALFLLWLLARVLPFRTLPYQIELSMAVELILILAIYIAVLYPVVRAKQWDNVALVSILLWMLVGDAIYYLGLLGVLQEGVQQGLYLGLYGVVFFILLMAKRVLPFFISKGLDVNLTCKDRPWLDYLSIVLFLLFALSDVFVEEAWLSAMFALPLVVLHGYRLVQWYHPRLQEKTLLWSLYLGYMGFICGFVLKTVEPFVMLSPTLALHAFAVGGVGLMSLAMMTRVSLGHTGRDVFNPHELLRWVFIAAFAGFVLRVIMPILMLEEYALWIELSQWCWLAAFSLFFIYYFPIWWKPRVDAD